MGRRLLWQSKSNWHCYFFYKLDVRTIFPLFENGHWSRLNGSTGTSLRATCPLQPLLSILLIIRDTRFLVDRVSLRPCCCDASILTVTIDVTGGDGWVVWGLLTFPLLKLQLLRGVDVGLVGKGQMVGSGTKLSFGAIYRP
eukprot:scaffold37349_cov35-Attheya_sp.AAC.2